MLVETGIFARVAWRTLDLGHKANRRATMAVTAASAANGDTSPPAGATPAAAAAAAGGPGALRFEDLTIDDSLPPIERVTRYCRSGIALQRLVHVKMLGEVAAQVG